LKKIAMNVVACPEHKTCFAVCCHDYTAINNNSVREVNVILSGCPPLDDAGQKLRAEYANILVYIIAGTMLMTIFSD
jgi:hypothetical protein